MHVSTYRVEVEVDFVRRVSLIAVISMIFLVWISLCLDLLKYLLIDCILVSLVCFFSLYIYVYMVLWFVTYMYIYLFIFNSLPLLVIFYNLSFCVVWYVNNLDCISH